MQVYATFENGRMTAASFDTKIGGAEPVDVPDDFDIDAIHHYAFDGVSVVYDPLPEDDEQAEGQSMSERIAVLEEKVRAQSALLEAYEAAYSEGVSEA